MTAELDLIAGVAPARPLPSAVMTPAERQAILAVILDTDGLLPDAALLSRRRPRRAGRGRTMVGLVVGLVAATLVVTGLTPLPGFPASSPKANAAIEALAAAAGDTPADLVRPGQYRHLVAQVTQGTETSTSETWISADGHTWRWDTYLGFREYFAFPPMRVIDGDGALSPEFLAGLPTNPGALNRYLRAHVSGSDSQDEAVFVAIDDMLRAGVAPPALRAAAIGVVEGLPHISAIAAVDGLGRPALKVTYTNPHNGSASALLFDRTTSALLGEESGPTFTVSYTEDNADAIPADVLEHAHMGPAAPPGVIASSAPTVGPTP